MFCVSIEKFTQKEKTAGFSTMSSRIMLQFPAPFLNHTEKQNYWRISIYGENKEGRKEIFWLWCQDEIASSERERKYILIWKLCAISIVVHLTASCIVFIWSFLKPKSCYKSITLMVWRIQYIANLAILPEIGQQFQGTHTCTLITLLTWTTHKKMVFLWAFYLWGTISYSQLYLTTEMSFLLWIPVFLHKLKAIVKAHCLWRNLIFSYTCIQNHCQEKKVKLLEMVGLYFRWRHRENEYATCFSLHELYLQLLFSFVILL